MSELIKSAKVIVISRGLMSSFNEIGARIALGLVPTPPGLLRGQITSQLYNNAELVFDEAFCFILKAHWSLLELEGLNSILQHPESSVIFASSTGYQLRSRSFSPLWGLKQEQVLLNPQLEVP